MASNFFVMEQVNLFCGVDDQTGKFLTLSSLKLPDLTETYQDHMPGGGPVGIEVSTGISKLEAGFNLNGEDDELLKKFGLGTPGRQIFTARASVRDKRKGTLKGNRAIIHARLGTISSDDFQRGELRGYEYTLNEIMHYELHSGDDELVYWDFFSNALRIGGVDQNGQANGLLGIA